MTPPGTIEIDKWQHFVVARKMVDNKVYAYKNGVLVGSRSFSKTPISGTDFVKIGWFSVNTIEGFIDDVRIYNRALSADEIQALYSNSVGRYH